MFDGKKPFALNRAHKMAPDFYKKIFEEKRKPEAAREARGKFLRENE